MNLQAIRRQAVPLHAEVATMLRYQIMSGELLPGTRLPALRELTEQLGVARMTVIQAMNTLVEEGLIERHAGRGTFVRDVELANRHTLHMKADMDQIHSMVEQMEVSVLDGNTGLQESGDGHIFRTMKRIHARDGKPFCSVEILLDDGIFKLAPVRFTKEIVVTVLKDIGIHVATARQSVTISYADFDVAQALGINVNSAVFRVFREFFSEDRQLIYSATLIYPGDLLEMEIEFSLDEATATTPA